MWPWHSDLTGDYCCEVPTYCFLSWAFKTVLFLGSMLPQFMALSICYVFLYVKNFLGSMQPLYMTLFFVCLFVCLFVRLFVLSFVHLFVRLFVSLNLRNVASC